MKKVQILLSTFNGELYLKEQLESLLKQNYSNFNILVRDDESSDRTVSILEEYQKNFGILKFFHGKNIGAWKSFFHLMEQADYDADYFALCDQDDYWLSDKIEKAVEQLDRMKQDKPLLYCSETVLVDQELKRLKVTAHRKKVRPAFGNAMVENICTGCTAVINRKLLEMAIKKVPEYTIMHDWWIYLIGSCFGEVVFDENAYIYYRQHGKNVIGARITRSEEIKYHMNTHSTRRGRNYRQLEEFNKVFKVTGEEGNLLELVLSTKESFGKRVEMIGNRKIFRQRLIYDLLYKGMVLIGDV